MTMRQTFFGLSKTIAGMALIGLGLFVLSGNVADAAARLTSFVGISADATQAFGEVAAVGLAASRVVQCYLFDRAGFARSVCRILISFWPLCLVTAGAVLTATASQTNSKNIQNKIRGLSI
jgi:uncharacterized membrane protein